MTITPGQNRRFFQRPVNFTVSPQVCRSTCIDKVKHMLPPGDGEELPVEKNQLVIPSFRLLGLQRLRQVILR